MTDQDLPPMSEADVVAFAFMLGFSFGCAMPATGSRDRPTSSQTEQ